MRKININKSYIHQMITKQIKQLISFTIKKTQRKQSCLALSNCEHEQKKAKRNMLFLVIQNC